MGGGTEHYRCRAPGEALRRLGWNVAYTDGSVGFDADVAVFQRVAEPWLPGLFAELRRQGTLVVYDIDDWYDNIPGYNPASAEVKPILRHVHDAMAAADVVTCSTPELAEAYSRLNRTVVLPNYLDPDIWSAAELAKFHTTRDKIHVGWAGHVDYRHADLDLLKPWLGRWLEDNPDVCFVGCGGRAILEHLGVTGIACPASGDGDSFRPYDHLPAMLTHLDVGLVPLVFNRFNQAKSWVKGLEYGAACAAAVASPSREYRKFIRPGVNGRLVRRNDWRGALNRTLDNLDTLKLGARRVAEEHMIDRHIHRWVDTYSTARNLAAV